MEHFMNPGLPVPPLKEGLRGAIQLPIQLVARNKRTAASVND
jgi:hypothetical protein